jgi:hypothetical protein
MLILSTWAFARSNLYSGLRRRGSLSAVERMPVELVAMMVGSEGRCLMAVTTVFATDPLGIS